MKLLLLINLLAQFNFRSVQTKFGLKIELVMISEMRLVYYKGITLMIRSI